MTLDKRAKIIVWIAGIIFAIGVISEGISSNNKTTTAAPKPTGTQLAAQAKAKTDKRKHEQQEVTAYIATALDKDSNIQLEISVLGTKIQKESSTQAYTDVKQIRDLADTYQTFFGTNDSAPADLPSDVQKRLNDAADNLSTAMYSYKSGLNDALDYLDTSKPSDVSDEKTQFGYAKTGENVANADFTKAKAAVGLK